MRGHVRKRGRSWAFVVELERDTATGNRRQHWQSGFATKKEAEKAMSAAIATLDRGLDPFPEKLTTAEYLNSWLERKRHEVRANTAKRYEQMVRDHISPVIGRIELARVRPQHIQSVLDEMRAKGLAARTVTQGRAALGNAFQQALGFGIITSNPVRAVKRPKIERAALSIPTIDQLRKLIRTAEGTMWEVPVLLAATTGARRSEILALRWSEVDLDAGRVRIVRSLHRTSAGLVALEPKTERARRQVALPPFAVERLRRYRAAQCERQLRIGGSWVSDDLVCDRGDGGPIDPDAFTGAFKRLARKAGLAEATRLHDVRHAVATTLLEQNLHPAITSSVLGHSSPAFTMSTYQHVLDGMTEKAASALASAYGM